MKTEYKIVVVEDNDTMRLGIQDTLEREDYKVHSFDGGDKATKHLEEQQADLVITDLRMEPMNGLEVLKKVKGLNPQCEVLLISAYGTVNDAVQAMQIGAADFLTKPFSPDELRIRVRQILSSREKDRMLDQLKAENEYLHNELETDYEEMIGTSEQMQRVFQLIDRIAAEDSSVLIEGESGTGKELVARAIHRNSHRKSRAFIKVNCGALNDNLLESELFGHEKGAFTGALKQRRGRFELANEGTLFLDEIGDISPAMQVKLLRALQEKEFERVGGEKTLKIDVRVIAASNKKLPELIAGKKFRDDLYYRLSVIPLMLPPLRDRKKDIPLLAEHFMKKFNSKRSIYKSITTEGMFLLEQYNWPGNIRELENLIERLHVISVEDEIPAGLVTQFLGGAGILPETQSENSGNLDQSLFQYEKKMIEQAMKNANGVKNRAAKLLGIRTSALYYKLEKFGLLK